ncbi:MAG: alpha/beta hydrolase [Planctomycetota bacterium]|jgi:S-formylglutathione hydrolase FrmB
MPLCTVSFFSQSLEKATAMNVILPEPSLKGPYYTLYQLHGLSDDYTIWMRRTSIERYVAGLPLVVVMPDGGRGFYTDAVEGHAYESHIMKDTIRFIEKFFPVIRNRRGRAIGGLSMGGYGAMKLGLKYPKVFGSIAAHSGAFLNARAAGFRANPEYTRIFGENPTGGPNDAFALAGKLAKSDVPAIRFDCGKSDVLLDGNRRLHRHLRKLGIKHTYAEYPGIHEWGYWDKHFPKALKFHRKALGF